MKIPPIHIKATAGMKIGIGIIAGIVVVVGGFLLAQSLLTKASDVAPRDLTINNIVSNTAKISWTTDQESQGVVESGSSPTSLNLFAPEQQKTKTHSVNLTLLSPSTSYYFQIRIGDAKYDNGGVPWVFTTAASAPVAPTATASGALTVSVTPVPSGVVAPTSAGAFGPLQGSSLKVAAPTGVPTLIPTTIPAPTALLPTITPALTSFYCTETDCQQICLKMKTGQCSTQDLQRAGNSCVGKINLYSCYFITPTLTPSPSPTPSPTLTPSPTPHA